MADKVYVILGGRKRRLFSARSRRKRREAPAKWLAREVIVQPKQLTLQASGRMI